MKARDLEKGFARKVSFDLRFLPWVPSSPGCYALSNIHEDILYIGETIDLRRRMEEHRKDPRMTQRTTMGLASWFHYMLVPAGEVKSTEDQLLVRYKFKETSNPPLNRKGP